MLLVLVVSLQQTLFVELFLLSGTCFLVLRFACSAAQSFQEHYRSPQDFFTSLWSVFSPRHNQNKFCFCARLNKNVRINSVVFSPRHIQNKFCFCARLNENVRINSDIFSPRHNQNKFCFCARLNENVWFLIGWLKNLVMVLWFESRCKSTAFFPLPPNLISA